MPPEQDSPLEALQKRLYQQPAGQEPAAQDAAYQVPAYSNQEPAAPYGWQAPPPPPPKRRLPWTLWFLIGTVAFLLLAGAAALFLIYHGTRAVSSERVQVNVQAPVSIASGDTVQLVITVHNGNPTSLNNASLFVTLPEGTRAGDGSDAPLTQYTDVLGNVAPGADVTRTVQVKLFGTAGQPLSIPMRVEYHTDGSNALFVTNKSYLLTVSTSPISVQVQTLSQSPSGQPLTLSVIVRSNASAPVANVALTAQYPSGFSVRSTDPAPAAANYFTLGTLAPGDQRVIKVTGILIGQNADQRTFRFTAGSVNPDGTSTLGNSYAEGDATVAITHPFLNVGVSLNRELADTVIANPGDTVNALLSWQNTLPDVLANASIMVTLSGNALDKSGITSGTGFYRSTDSSVVFDSTTNPALASLAAGDTGAGSFAFKVKPAAALAGIKNPTISLTVSVTGQQGVQGGSAQLLTSTLTRTVKVGSTVTVSSSVAHRKGVDSGPVPPAAGTETTYTVTLDAKNGVSSIGAAKETFQLPSYVRFTGVADSGVLYNPDARTVTWNIGDMQPSGSASAHFQVAITPSTSQQGNAPVLVNEQSFSGVDRFTGQQVSALAPALTTELQGSRGSGTVK